MTSTEFRALRQQLGLTQRALAEQLGVAWITVARYETGSQIPEPVARLLRLLAVPGRHTTTGGHGKGKTHKR